MDEYLNIDTPENVDFNYEIAGIGSRFMAAAVDYAILVLAQAVLIVGTLFFTSTSVPELIEGDVEFSIIAILIIILFLLNWGYFIYFELSWNGQTPGKRMVGLRTIGVNGLPALAGAIIIRNLIRAIDFLPFAYGVGVITMFVHPQFRRLGDLGAGTLVIFDQTASELKDLRPRSSSQGAPVAITDRVLNLPIARLDGRDFVKIERFLNRRSELVNSQPVANQILKKLYQKMDVRWIEGDHPGSSAVRELQELYYRMRQEEG